MHTRLADGRREELLDGVMALIARDGFSTLRIADIARDLCCSIATLYKIAPSKDSLVLLAIRRWGDRTLADIEVTSDTEAPAARARAYFRAGARSLNCLSPRFREDVDRFESTRTVWRTIADAFVDRFTELLRPAIDDGAVVSVDPRFLGRLLRQMAFVTRDESALAESGLTAEEALLVVDSIVWDGILARPNQPAGAARA